MKPKSRLKFLNPIISLLIGAICIMTLFSRGTYNNYSYYIYYDYLDNSTINSIEEGMDKSYPSSVVIGDERRLFCKHTDLDEFYRSIQNPKEFILNGDVVAGIIPHHMAAATLISGFFKTVADSGREYDTVVIVAPNHEGAAGDIVVSFKDWHAWDTVYCDRDIVEGIYRQNPDGIMVTESDDRMETDHSASVFIPYISHYLPEAEVAAFLLSRRLTLENIYNFTKILSDEIKASGKRVLFIASIDFSHYLPVPIAIENDRVSEAAILDRNYRLIQEFSNDYVDSPQSLNTFLLYLKNSDTDNIEILYNSDMSEFYGDGINETTSYFIITAYE